MKSRTIKVDYLARVEGEGGLFVKIKGQQVTDVQLKIFEPPRFFEAFLRGRKFHEAPDITARICGICPIAYQMSACHAMEDACGVKITGPIRDLRRLIYCGEWIESHALHVYLLHAPDFLGYEDAIRMAKDHPDEVKRGLRLKKAGNEIVRLLGGREIHPINVRVGGFYKVPDKQEFAALAEELKWARDAALETVRWVATFTFPDFDRDYEFVALRHPDEYPFNEGRLVSNKGLDIAVREYDQHFVEEHVAHSNALQSRLKERNSYFVGPLARYNLNFDKLSPAGAGSGPQRRARAGVPQSVPEHHRAQRGNGVCLRRGAAHHRALRDARQTCGGRRAARRHRLRLHRSAARHSLSPLSPRRPRHDSGCQDCSAHLAEPEDHRRTTCGSLSRPTWSCPRTSCSGSASRQSATTIPASRAPPTS